MSSCGSNKTISLLKEEKVRVNGLLAAGLVGGVAPSRTSLAQTTAQACPYCSGS